jgi:hypothetical protein
MIFNALPALLPPPPFRRPHLRAEAVKWTGTLTIPPPGSGIYKESVVSADDSALFALLQRLDRKFRGAEEEPLIETTAAASAQPLP